MTRCAVTGRLLCEACSDPIDPDELVLDGDDPYHEGECSPAGVRELQGV